MIRNIFFFIFVYVLTLIGVWIFILNNKFLCFNGFLESISLYSGLIKYQYLSPLLFLFFLFSLGGLPPFPSFVAKIFWLVSLMKNFLDFFVVVVLLVTLLVFFFYIRIGKHIFYDNTKHWYFITNVLFECSYLFFFIFIFNCILIFNPSFIFSILECSIF
jgi:NADH-quinone oxidoreductase subunit N